jgi:hypothetical protein
MAARSLRKQLGGINFMTLQDLITGLIGILIVFCIILILSATKTQSAQDTAEENADEQLKNLVGQIEILSNDLDKIRKGIAGKGPLASAQAVSNQIQQITGKLEKMGTVASAGADDALSTQNENIEKEIADLVEKEKVNQVKIDRLKAALKGEQRSSLFLPGADAGKEVLVLDVGGDMIKYFWLSNPRDNKELRADDGQGVNKLLGALDKDKDHVVCFIRPKGILLYRKISGLLKSMGISLGTDSIPEGAKLNLVGKEN